MKKGLFNFAAFLLIFMVLTACLGSSETPTIAPTPAFTPLPTRTPEPEPPSSLIVCLGREPNSLYPFGELNDAARVVLSAVNNGPFDILSYEYQPVILTHMPSLENGEARIISIEVQAGDLIVDADGELVLLDAGVRVHPTGCRNEDCVIAYDGESPLEMEQMVVDFRMRPDLTWSDGTPLTAEDSVYAFGLASLSNENEFLISRTQIYEAADLQTVQWWGVAGFVDGVYLSNFWSPAPRHIWSQFPDEELPSVDVASFKPIGWGPYMVAEWIPTDRITLVRNPYYFRERDGYPKIDLLEFRFIPDPDLALSEFIAGRCDILDPTIPLETHLGLLQSLQDTEQAQVFVVSGMSVEWLAFGITPSSYDEGYDPLRDRQDIFADLHTRQGIAHCLDRQSVADVVFFGLADVPTTYLPSNHPAHDSNIQKIPYNPEIGSSPLELAGWLDSDDDPSTPRRAVNVRNVAFNTPLELNYFTTGATQRRQVVDILESSLAACGIGLNVQYLLPNDLYAPGPGGPLFGRNFDLAEYALGVNGIEPPCNWFATGEIPSADNSWTGTNISGYSNDEYDAACRAAQLALPEEQNYTQSYRRTQIIFSNELPALPLYHRLRIAVARPDLCGFDLDPTAVSLWNIEAIEVGESCQK
jgi:peptide/nickel transport system substrate-binding protein